MNPEMYTTTVKTESSHDANFVDTGGTVCCSYNNMRCRRSQKVGTEIFSENAITASISAFNETLNNPPITVILDVYSYCFDVCDYEVNSSITFD